MWFKNLSLFRLQEPFTLNATELAERLGQFAFHPCLSQEMVSYGWVPPLGRKAVDLVHSANGRLLLCLQAEEKVLPAAVIREVIEEKVAEIEDREMRTVRRREKNALRDDVLLELLPKAFSRSRHSYAYIDPAQGWLVVNSASRKAVEELTGLLRKTLDSLPIEPPQVASAPDVIMTHWLAHGNLPTGLVPEDECELRDAGEEGGVVRCKGQDLSGEEIRSHLQAGKQVTRVALSWEKRISFVLAEDLIVRRLRFADVVRESLADVDNPEALFDAEFALMTGELGLLLPRLLEFFGGEQKLGG